MLLVPRIQIDGSGAEVAGRFFIAGLICCIVSGSNVPANSLKCTCGLDTWDEPSLEVAGWEYEGKCDIDVLESAPSLKMFDRKYFGRRPLLIRNYTVQWQATKNWQKRTLWEKLQSHKQQYVKHLSTDSYWVSFHNHNRSTKNVTLIHFLCHEICRKPFGIDGHDQLYAFDRDQIVNDMPWLKTDYEHFSLMAAHFEPGWHERWSRYFLVAGVGSGINFHQHTDAYNGLVFGRKRWFLYPPEHEPPLHKIGALAWFKTVYRDDWKHKGKGNRLVQCMQNAGDLLYVPRNWWHATISLREGIGVSGQFVRKAHEILQNASRADKAGRMMDALTLWKTVWRHRSDVEKHIQFAVLLNMAIAHLRLGNWTAAEKTAKKYLRMPGAPDDQRVHQVLNAAQQNRAKIAEL